MLKFDYIIQNPPYAGTLHTKFFNKGLDILSDTGKMVIIEPSTWLINLRKGVGDEPRIYEPMKKRVEGHVKKVIIENYNKDFGTELYMPFAITYIDNSQKINNISFSNCGEIENVTSIYDCNLIGDYSLIQSILTKCKNYGDMMKDHIYHPGKTKVDENTWFCKYPQILGGCGASFCGTVSPRNGANINSDNIYITLPNGNQYITPYISACYHYNKNEISHTILYRYDKSNKITDKPADCLYGTKNELENWKYFVFNNKLPLALNIILINDQHNNSIKFVPWLVNKQYSDEEIYKLLNINNKEIQLINNITNRYKRNSKWFKRYMTGV